MKAYPAFFLLFLCSVFSVRADFGIGAQGNAWFSSNPFLGGSLVVSPLRRLHISLDYNTDIVTPENRRFGLNTDYWIFKPRVGDFGPEQGRVYLLCGGGIFINFSGDVSCGLRFPFGVDYEIKRMDFFLQVVPAVSVYAPSGDWFALYGALGCRWWF
ncbi:MAG: hypothetical protein LBD20_03965 [Spirochaetaceae bacterium]|jgi:hypothetical protein|nr:hypothetical protein [Spirochaetaceae bacterium]